MFTSLYSILLPLIAQEETGTLNIHHTSGDEARIIIESGKILMIETLDLQGSDAAKKIAMWVNFTTDFFANEVENSYNQIAISTKKFLAFFEKVDKRIEKIKKIITKDDDCFKFLPKKVNSTINFEASQLEIAMLLDGKRTVTEIIADAKQPDLQTLSHLAVFCSKGFVKIIEKEELIPKKERAKFFDELNETLSNILGPAAEIVIDDALDSIELEAKNLSKSNIPGLFDSVLKHLDPEDRAAMRDWTAEQLKKYTQ